MTGARVECRSEHTYAQRPTALHWQGQRLVVEELEDAWREPDGRGFRVRCAGGRRFELIYHEPADEWQVRELI